MEEKIEIQSIAVGFYRFSHFFAGVIAMWGCLIGGAGVIFFLFNKKVCFEFPFAWLTLGAGIMSFLLFTLATAKKYEVCPYCSKSILIKTDWQCPYCNNFQEEDRYLWERCKHCHRVLETAFCEHCHKEFKL